MASVCVGLVDFAISFGVLLALMAWYGLTPSIAMLTVPFWTTIAVLTALGVGLWLSALNVRYRDIRYTLPFLTQIWLFATPVAYSSSLVPEHWSALYALNPMVGVVDGFRWAMLGTARAPWDTALISLGVVLVIVVTGAYYFRRMERTFADVL
jgi:lipopolysaccharide transport system permease protein